MARHALAQKKADRAAFPVVVRYRVPEGGFAAFGMNSDPHEWLRLNLGLGNYAVWSIRGGVKDDGAEFLFKDAGAFHRRFQSLEFLDGTLSPTYTSPYKTVNGSG